MNMLQITSVSITCAKPNLVLLIAFDFFFPLHPFFIRKHRYKVQCDNRGIVFVN